MIDPGDNSATAVTARYREFEAQLGAQCNRLGRPREEVTLVVVTKFQDVAVNQALASAGQLVFGESRHQEARHKVGAPGLEHASWHFVGQLQSNKARQVVRYISALHSLDRPSLLSALDDPDREREIECFLQINLTDDPSRGGVNPDQIAQFAEQVLQAQGVRLAGVMGVPGLNQTPRQGFDMLLDLRNRLLGIAPDATAISAGMSGDWQIALEYGATHLRVGTAITGNRPILP